MAIRKIRNQTMARTALQTQSAGSILKKPKKKPCKCVAMVNAQLKAHNAQIDIGTLINFKTGKCRSSPPMLQLTKIDPKIRKKLPTLFCTFCPVCGVKLPTE